MLKDDQRTQRFLCCARVYRGGKHRISESSGRPAVFVYKLCAALIRTQTHEVKASTAFTYFVKKTETSKPASICQAVEREEKVWEREEPSATEKSYVTTSKELQSQLSVV